MVSQKQDTDLGLGFGTRTIDIPCACGHHRLSPFLCLSGASSGSRARLGGCPSFNLRPREEATIPPAAGLGVVQS